jgi:hypothetical protein
MITRTATLKPEWERDLDRCVVVQRPAPEAAAARLGAEFDPACSVP